MTNETQTKKTLEILVVEDTLLHQESAKALLAGHNVEIVGSFDEAVDRISGPSNYARNPSSQKKKYDAVLTDMFLPQGRGDCLGDKSQASTEQPFGYPIALMACKEGTPYVAVLSHANHHANAMAYSTDFFTINDRAKGYCPIVQQVGSSRMVISNCCGIETAYKTPDGRIGTAKEIGTEKESTFSPGRKFFKEPEGSEFVKNWKAILDIVMGKPQE